MLIVARKVINKVNPQCLTAPEELFHVIFFRMAFVCQQAYNHFSRTSSLPADFGSISQHAYNFLIEGIFTVSDRMSPNIFCIIVVGVLLVVIL